MAVPLRKAAGSYVDYTPAWLPEQEYPRRKSRDLTPRRLVKRQLRSNADFRRTLAWVFVGMSAVLFSLSMAHIFLKSQVSALNYQINSLQSENQQILLENEEIRTEISELRSLERIEAIAREQLGLVKNQKIDYMVLSSTLVAEGKIKTEEAELGRGRERRETSGGRD